MVSCVCLEWVSATSGRDHRISLPLIPFFPPLPPSPLPSLHLCTQAGESVLAVRSALAEQPATAHLTSFRLVLRPPSDSDASDAAATGDGDGPGAVVVERGADGLVELNDVLELAE